MYIQVKQENQRQKKKYNQHLKKDVIENKLEDEKKIVIIIVIYLQIQM
jgi:hypothetical protein